MSATPFGRYLLIEAIGQDAIGEVYRAQDTITGRMVALRLLPPQLTHDAAVRQRLHDQPHALLGMPYQVPIHSVGEHDGRLYADMALQPPPGRPDRRGGRRLAIAVLAAIVGGYLLAVGITSDRWLPTTTTQERATATLQPAPGSEDGTIAEARGVITARLAAFDIADAEVSDDGGSITVSVPATDADALEGLGAVGRFDLRPVIHAIDAESPQRSTAPTRLPDSEQVAAEKDLRQNTNPQVQLLSLQFQAVRCGDEDFLTALDDPDLPLITCGNGQAFLLDKAIVTGAEIEDATAEHDDRRDTHFVKIQLDSAATERWADFTAGNIGSEVAITVDTQVVRALTILEEIPSGVIDIQGSFTETEAQRLAADLTAGALPFPLHIGPVETEVVTVQADSTGWRIGLLAVGVVVLLVAVGGIIALRRGTPHTA
ncbi:SecDF P1 head subdomain-containing protein [Mycolicibacterium thermoresistibile]